MLPPFQTVLVAAEALHVAMTLADPPVHLPWLDHGNTNRANLDLARRRGQSSNGGNPAERCPQGYKALYSYGRLGLPAQLTPCIMAGSLSADSVDRSEDTLEQRSTNRYHAHSCLRAAHFFQTETAIWQFTKPLDPVQFRQVPRAVCAGR